jgi:hypothetical protein
MKSSMMIICNNKELSNSDHQDYLEQETSRSSLIQSTRQNNKAKQFHYTVKSENGTLLKSCIGNGTFELSYGTAATAYPKTIL